MRTQRSLQAVLLFGVLLTGVFAATTFAQPDHGTHQPDTAKTEQSLVDQFAELRAKVARLEAALEQNHRGSQMKGEMDGMKMMKGMSSGGMGMDSMGKGGMKMMKGMSSGGMGMDDMDMGGMKMMGMMKGKGMMGGMPSATAQSSLPGFPGASHIYHIGAASFFLDHDEHIQLTQEQRAAINKIKQQSELAQNTASRKVEEAEQQLWELTASDTPDAKKIEQKVREIEKLRANRRLDFIRSVGNAAEVLTEDQRKALVGQSPEEPAPADQQQHKH